VPIPIMVGVLTPAAGRPAAGVGVAPEGVGVAALGVGVGVGVGDSPGGLQSDSSR
jgi:hypothetical protein